MRDDWRRHDMENWQRNVQFYYRLINLFCVQQKVKAICLRFKRKKTMKQKTKVEISLDGCCINVFKKNHWLSVPNHPSFSVTRVLMGKAASSKAPSQAQSLECQSNAFNMRQDAKSRSCHVWWRHICQGGLCVNVLGPDVRSARACGDISHGDRHFVAFVWMDTFHGSGVGRKRHVM